MKKEFYLYKEKLDNKLIWYSLNNKKMIYLKAYFYSYFCFLFRFFRSLSPLLL